MPQLPMLPAPAEMYQALVNRDESYAGVFVAAIRTTGIVCRPGCPARTPRAENVEYFPTVRDALLAGYRPCRRCRPLESPGEAPEWLHALLTAVDANPERRWTDASVRALGLDPGRVRRWFRKHHGMTFHAYLRARRLGHALGRLRLGDDLTQTAYELGYDSLSGFRDAFTRLFGATPGRSRDADTVAITRIVTPLGPMVAGATDRGVCLLEFADRRALERQITALRRQMSATPVPGEHPLLDTLAHELQEYFAGERRAFSVPLHLAGTPFQEACWRYLCEIPYGETRSYAEEARALGRTRAVRAVGRANGENRIAILIPCHRVIRGDGQLAGYGGGLWRKRLLLEMERSGRALATDGDTRAAHRELAVASG